MGIGTAVLLCVFYPDSIYSLHSSFMTNKRINKISNEGEIFKVPLEIAKLSNLVVTTLGEEEHDDDHDDNDDDDNAVEIPLPNVKASVLAKVVEFCTHYKEEPMKPITTPLESMVIDEIVQSFYARFVEVDQVMLFELVTAANFMDIKPLLDLTCLAVSIYIKGKSPDEIRRIFNISNDMSQGDGGQVGDESKMTPNGSASH
eukprot:CCRYP_002965-RA/>CCRYP_002965-RA protein AED:0.12 eAED:0.12 QI:442/1/1/1/0.66/0.75/4/605/201